MRREFQRRSRSYRARQYETREPLPRILIVCEGTKTEPSYFKQFRVSGLEVRVEGTGTNTKDVVLCAEELCAEEQFDTVWCVFDRDSFSPERFNAALEMAAARRMSVAYSNEAFELWYILHFDYLQSGLPRAGYEAILTDRIGTPYRKNDPMTFERLRDRQTTAIRNAQRLLAQYDPRSPERDNPSTTVHLLVEYLRKFER
jgi:hypothetical protein